MPDAVIEMTGDQLAALVVNVGDMPAGTLRAPQRTKLQHALQRSRTSRTVTLLLSPTTATAMVVHVESTRQLLLKNRQSNLHGALAALRAAVDAAHKNAAAPKRRPAGGARGGVRRRTA